MSLLADPHYSEGAFAVELAALEAAGLLLPPLDGEFADLPDGPLEISEADYYDTFEFEAAAVEALEWETFAAIDQDEAKRFFLQDRAPAWMTLPPGGELARALEQVRPGVESPTALIEVLKGSARLVAWGEAIKIAAMASFYRQREAQAAEIPRYDESGRPADPMRSAAAEIAAALRLSPATVDAHINSALRLTSTLKSTYRMLRCGAISLSKALNIAEATAHLDEKKAQEVERLVLERAPRQTQAGLKAALRRAVAKVDAANHAKRHRKAVEERQCRMVPLADGMAGLWITHSADKIRALYTAVQSLAACAKAAPADGTPADGTVGGEAAAPDQQTRDQQTPDQQTPDRRTAEQRRADVVVDLFEQILANGLDWLGRRLPDQHRRKPHIEVLVPLGTLLGLDDESCELTGYGPIPAEMARAIARDGTWRRLLTDPATGAVLEASTARHDPGAQVSETMLARHPVCAWIGCNRPARESDRDHGRKFRETGETALWDLRPFCENHHLIKDTVEWGWSVTNHADGSTTFESPTGHRYTREAFRPGPIANLRRVSANDDEEAAESEGWGSINDVMDAGIDVADSVEPPPF